MSEATEDQHLIGYYYALMLGEQLAPPFPRHTKKLLTKLGTFINRVELRDNQFDIDLDTLTSIKDKIQAASNTKDEKKFNDAIEELFSWARVNNIWIGTKKYNKTTWMKADNGYKIGK